MIEGQLISTGAFEVSLNGMLVIFLVLFIMAQTHNKRFALFIISKEEINCGVLIL